MAKEFICKASSYVHNHTTKKGNLYRFFNGKPYLVKDKDDIKEFEENNLFVSVDKMEKVIDPEVEKIADIVQDNIEADVKKKKSKKK